MRIPYFLTLLISIFVLSCSGKKKTEEQLPKDVYYTCSMDPQVIEYKPGKCPICKMELTPVKKNEAENKDELHISGQQMQLGNIHTDTVRNLRIGDQLVLTATLNFDQEKTYSLSSRIAGRIEKLYFKNTGDYIAKGSPLYTLYSEELNNAKQEYLLALQKKAAFTGEPVIDFDRLIESARNKLLLWGLTEEQLKELAKPGKFNPVTTFFSRTAGYITQLDVKEGDYVMDGARLVKLADLSTLWAEAQVYTSQMTDVKQNSKAIVRFPDYDGEEMEGKIQFINPEINPETRINLIRIVIPNQQLKFRPGMPAYVLLKSPVKTAITVPIDALIRDGRGASVWIRTGSNTFKNRMVETGLENADRIEIKKGLEQGDLVVVTGAYLLQSEFLFKKGSDPMAGHTHH